MVIALCVIMGQERNRSGLQRLLSEEDQAVQALILKGAHETLDMGRQIGRPGQGTPSRSFAARLSFFTLRGNAVT
jgi:hypothetical protein